MRKICSIYNIKTVKKFKPSGVKAERNEMIAYLAKKFTYESIGKVFGVTRERVRQIKERSKKNSMEMMEQWIYECLGALIKEPTEESRRIVANIIASEVEDMCKN